jgi:hypothetical protein
VTAADVGWGTRGGHDVRRTVASPWLFFPFVAAKKLLSRVFTTAKPEMRGRAAAVALGVTVDGVTTLSR